MICLAASQQTPHRTRRSGGAIRAALLAGLLAGLLAAPMRAHATVMLSSVFVSATTGNTVSVTAGLTIAGNTLTIVLTNNAPDTSASPDDVLTGFIFDIAGRPTLSYISAKGTTATSLRNSDSHNTNRSLNVAKGWGYQSGFDASNAWRGYYGLATNAFTGRPDVFDNTGPSKTKAALGNADYGIATGANILDTNFPGISTLVWQSATFTLAGLSGLTEASISSQATFAFGNGTVSAAVPEPATAVLLVSGLSLLAMRCWRARRRRPPRG